MVFFPQNSEQNYRNKIVLFEFADDPVVEGSCFGEEVGAYQKDSP